MPLYDGLKLKKASHAADNRSIRPSPVARAYASVSNRPFEGADSSTQATRGSSSLAEHVESSNASTSSGFTRDDARVDEPGPRGAWCNPATRGSSSPAEHVESSNASASSIHEAATGFTRDDPRIHEPGRWRSAFTSPRQAYPDFIQELPENGTFITPTLSQVPALVDDWFPGTNFVDLSQPLSSASPNNQTAEGAIPNTSQARWPRVTPERGRYYGIRGDRVRSQNASNGYYVASHYDGEVAVGNSFFPTLTPMHRTTVDPDLRRLQESNTLRPEYANLTYRAQAPRTHAQNRRASEEPSLLTNLSALPPPMKQEDLKVMRDCKVCYEQLADVLLLPCGHCVLCRWCAAEHISPTAHNSTVVLSSVDGPTCPMCRSNVRSKVGSLSSLYPPINR